MTFEVLMHANQKKTLNFVDRSVLESAAKTLPGFKKCEIVLIDKICVGLVETNFQGGDYGTILRNTRTGDIHIHLTRREIKHDLDMSNLGDINKQGSEDPGISIIISAAGDQFTVYNDGVGFINSYFAEKDDDFWLSTSLHALVQLGLPLDWDLKGVAEYLYSMHQYEDRTLLLGAKLLPAGSCLKWRIYKALDIKCNPLLMKINDRAFERDENEYVNEFQYTWSIGIERILNETQGDLTIGSSGGLDSRLIANGLNLFNHDASTFTYGIKNALELVSAVAIAEKLRLPHKAIWVQDKDSLRNFNLCLQFLDGAHSAFELYESWYISEILELSNNLVSGTSGDVFWGNEPALGVKSTDSLITQKINFFNNQIETTERAINEDYIALFRRHIDDSIRSSIAAVEQDQPYNTALLWNLMNRQRRWGFSLNGVLRRFGISYYNPYFDKDFIDFIGNLPNYLRKKGRLHLSIHKNLYPNTARIPYSSTSGGIPPALLETLYPPKRYKLSEAIKNAPDIGITMGLKGIYKKILFKMEKQHKYAQQLAKEYKRRNFVTNIFNSRRFYANKNVYYKKFNYLIEMALESVPAFISNKSLLALKDSAILDNNRVDLNMVGRIICLCLWEKQWKEKIN